MVEAWIREEVAEREARALGLDRNDPVIRRRLRQKLEFLSEATADQNEPSEAELRRWLDHHPERYRRPATYSFQQVFLDPSRGNDPRGGDEPSGQRAAGLLRRLNGASPPDPASLGDPLLLVEPSFTALSGTELERLFGRQFAAALARLQPGPAWVGPLRSGYGEHLVRLRERQPGALPPLAEVRQAVELDWRQEQRQRQREEDHQRRLARYRVVRPALPTERLKPNPPAQPTAATTAQPTPQEP